MGIAETLFKSFPSQVGGGVCRGGITADAIGWLKLWARIGVGESGEGVSVQETLMKKQARTSKNKEKNKYQEPRTKNREPNDAQHTRFTLLRGP